MLPSLDRVCKIGPGSECLSESFTFFVCVVFFYLLRFSSYVRIQQHSRRATKRRRPVENAMILQAVILLIEIPMATANGCRVSFCKVRSSGVVSDARTFTPTKNNPLSKVCPP